MEGVPILYVRKLLRHGNIQLIERYARLAPDHVVASIKLSTHLEHHREYWTSYSLIEAWNLVGMTHA